MAELMMQHKADELAAKQTIPAGYKQTEVGLIPEDWALVTIDDVASFSGGSQPAKNFFSSEPKDGYIRLIQIRDYKTSEYETYIPAYLARKLCSEHDIMIGRYGPPIFQILRGISGAYNVALIKTEPKRLIDREYLFYILKTDRLFLLMDMLSQRSSGQTGIELPALKAYPIPLPSKQEQIAISNVLSDIDALTAGLERLITKKQSVKTATMQQLLTGRTRLPQFALRPDGTPKGYKLSELGDIPEDWEIKQIIQFTDCTAGGTPSTSIASYWGGEHPWMSSGELHLKRVFDVSVRITDEGLGNSSTKYVPADSVLIGLAGQGKTRGTVAIAKIPLCTNQSIASVFPSAEHCPEFLFYNLDSRYEELRELSTGDGGRGGLNLAIIRKLKVIFPDKGEQSAIANVLSDMDSELAVLEQKLAKARNLKQGMMQQLLTGRIRLPVEQVV